MREHLRAATFGRSLIDFRLCDFSSATLAQADTPTRKPWRSDQGKPPKKIGWATPNTPGTPPAAPGPGPPTAATEALRREHRRPDMQAPPPRERPAEDHRKRHTRQRRERKRHTQAQGRRRTKEK
nr:MAG TPA: hypothetical protein [Caudoviricetes sp.]